MPVARLWRLPMLALLLVGGLAIEAAWFPLVSTASRRRIIGRWSRSLLRAAGLRLRPDPLLAATAPGRLVVANHVSWLDIVAINAVAPAAFVATAEIRRWPVIGGLVAMAGTVFIERGRRHAVRDVIATMRERLATGWPVAIFPEAKTSDGERLLPFHANLIEAAREENRDVLAVALVYRDAADRWPTCLAWVGETSFAQSLWRVTGARGLTVEVALVETLAVAGRTRHAIANDARLAISRRLELPLADSAPGTAPPIRA